MGGRILFVSHQASRTGAPLMLLQFLRWLRENTPLEFSVLLMRSGELATEFAEVAPVALFEGDPPDASRVLRVMRRLGGAGELLKPFAESMSPVERAVRVRARRAAVRDLQRRAFDVKPPDLVYLNSVGSCGALSVIPESTRVLTHVHELSLSLRDLRRARPDFFAEMLSRTDAYIAASHAVRAALITDYAVSSNRIDVCHSFIPIEAAPPDQLRVAAEWREKLALSPHTLVVGSVGTIGWLKGADLFIQVAKRTIDLLAGNKEVVFVWIGAEGDWWEDAVRHDLGRLGLDERVRFLPAMPDASSAVELFDVFALTSRSDSYPLSCLEAAARAKPVVCFDAGGMTEFLEPEERLVMPYLDIDTMAARICELLAKPSERQLIGEALARRVRQRHRLELAAPGLLEHIEHAIYDGQHAGQT
jgi:glycosyltransferase involved in cell wall biosynthesis